MNPFVEFLEFVPTKAQLFEKSENEFADMGIEYVKFNYDEVIESLTFGVTGGFVAPPVGTY